MAVGLKAGETFILAGLAKDSTPEVQFTDNPNCFLLECSGPGKCSVLGAEAGHGRVRAKLKTGETVVYDISVSAVAHPGKPLEPGVTPPPAGDIFAGSATAGNGSTPVPSTGNVSRSGASAVPAAAPPSPAGGEVAPMGAGGATSFER